MWKYLVCQKYNVHILKVDSNDDLEPMKDVYDQMDEDEVHRHQLY